MNKLKQLLRSEGFLTAAYAVVVFLLFGAFLIFAQWLICMGYAEPPGGAR